MNTYLKPYQLSNTLPILDRIVSCLTESEKDYLLRLYHLPEHEHVAARKEYTADTAGYVSYVSMCALGIFRRFHSDLTATGREVISYLGEGNDVPPESHPFRAPVKMRRNFYRYLSILLIGYGAIIYMILTADDLFRALAVTFLCLWVFLLGPTIYATRLWRSWRYYLQLESEQLSLCDYYRRHHDVTGLIKAK